MSPVPNERTLKLKRPSGGSSGRLSGGPSDRPFGRLSCGSSGRLNDRF